MGISKELKNLKEMVGFCLEKYPETRDSDKKLWITYMTQFQGLAKINNAHSPYMYFIDLFMDEKNPSMESIRRIRQKFQENGQYAGEKRALKMEEAGKVKDVLNSWN